MKKLFGSLLGFMFFVLLFVIVSFSFVEVSGSQPVDIVDSLIMDKGSMMSCPVCHNQEIFFDILKLNYNEPIVAGNTPNQDNLVGTLFNAKEPGKDFHRKGIGKSLPY